jgi:hypothetical protein
MSDDKCYEYCEIVFGEGALGLKIYSEDGNFPVKIKSFYSTTFDSLPSRAERCGLLRRDDVITKIGDLDVSKLSYEDVLRQIVKSKRPVALRFSRYNSTPFRKIKRADLTKMKDPKKTTPARKKSTTLGEVVDRDNNNNKSSWTSSVLSSFNSNNSSESSSSSSTSKPKPKPPEVPSRTRSELLYDVLMRDTIDVDRLAKLSFSGVCFLSPSLSPSFKHTTTTTTITTTTGTRLRHRTKTTSGSSMSRKSSYRLENSSGLPTHETRSMERCSE